MSSPHEVIVDAILFDMDGTLVDSTRATDETFRLFVEEHDLDISGHPHGVRMVDSMKSWFPNKSEAERSDLCVKYEADIIKIAQKSAKKGEAGIRILPGVARLLHEITSGPDAEKCYAICTSASREFASAALSTAGITPPTHLLTADDCTHGKPHPEPYLKGAKLLSQDAKNCLVVEDAPLGIKSGATAGATTVAVCTSHTREKVEGLGAQFVVDTLEKVHVQWTEEGKMRITIEQC